MKNTTLTIKDLFAENEKLTFLVGAGCSVDEPSCQPAGRTMINAMIKFACPDLEFEKISKIKDLRFEGLVEIIRNVIDKDLKLIDYYSLCDKPNIQHHFLANMIKKGHFVMTTNFDFLIEHALFQTGVSKDTCLCVITKSDFEKNTDPLYLYNQGKFCLYKIHGSTKNLITNESTKESLVATIQAFGSNKEGLNVFQMEPFKKPLFENITQGRSLIVMGYSGSDDFDVVPTLKVLKALKNVIWINYISDDGGKEKIYKIDESISKNLKDLDKVNQILLDILRSNNIENVYRIDVNTSRMIKDLLEKNVKISYENFNINPKDWMKNNIENPDEIVKINIARNIYHDFGMFDDALRCAFQGLELSKKKGKEILEGGFYNDIALSYRAQGKYKEALEYFKKSLELNEKIENLEGKLAPLHNIGILLNDQGKYEEAIGYLQKALEITEKINNLEVKGKALGNLGISFLYQEKYNDALDYIQKSLNIHKELGNLLSMSLEMNNIGVIYKNLGEYSKAIDYYNQALKIKEQISDLRGLALTILNIGVINRLQKKYIEAKEKFEDSIKICDSIGYVQGKLKAITNIGLILIDLKKYEEAINYFNNSTPLIDEIGNLSEKGLNLNRIADLYYRLNNFDKSLEYYMQSFETYEKLGDIKGMASNIPNIGIIKMKEGKINEAIKYFEKTVELFKKLGNIENEEQFLNNLGIAYNAIGDVNKAYEYCQKAFNISKSLNNSSITFQRIMNLIILSFNLNKYDETRELISQGLKINEDIANNVNKSFLLNASGVLYYKQKNFDKAIIEYKNSIDIYPKNENSYYNLSCIYSLKKNNNEALQYLKKAIQLNPEIKKKAVQEPDLVDIKNLEEFKKLIT